MSKKHLDMRFLRIISGESGGRKIVSPDNRGKTHPMGERERQALSNSLGPKISGATVLDLYAGTGALGLEALSRGAAEAVFIEKDKKAFSCIVKNVRELGYENRATVIFGDVKIALGSGGLAEESFDIILCDPPYDHFYLDEFRSVTDYLVPGGAFVLSHPSDEAPELFDLKLESTRKYAAARVSFYRKA